MADLAPLTEDEVKRFMETVVPRAARHPRPHGGRAPPAWPRTRRCGSRRSRSRASTPSGLVRPHRQHLLRRGARDHPQRRHRRAGRPVGRGEDRPELAGQGLDPPAAKSQWIGFNAGQTHEVGPLGHHGQPVIQVYGVDTFVAMPGSSNLPVLAREIIGQYYELRQRRRLGRLADAHGRRHGRRRADWPATPRGSPTCCGIGDQCPTRVFEVPDAPAADRRPGRARGGDLADSSRPTPPACPIDAIGANYFQVHDGKITYMRTIHDSVPFKPFTDQKLGEPTWRYDSTTSSWWAPGAGGSVMANRLSENPDVTVLALEGRRRHGSRGGAHPLGLAQALEDRRGLELQERPPGGAERPPDQQHHGKLLEQEQ